MKFVWLVVMILALIGYCWVGWKGMRGAADAGRAQDGYFRALRRRRNASRDRR